MNIFQRIQPTFLQQAVITFIGLFFIASYSYSQDSVSASVNTVIRQNDVTMQHSIRSWNYFSVSDTANSNALLSQRNGVWNVSPATQKQILLLNTEAQKSFSSIYLVGSGTIVFGGITAFAKLHSDNLYQQYLDEYNTKGTINGKLRDDVRKYDTISALSLVVTEIGFLYLSYSLLNF